MSHAPRSPAELESRRVALEAELGDEVTLDGLTREFSVFQRRRGHRTSTDDLLTAWYAMTHAPDRVRSLLDLGTGIGSVGLTLAWRFEEATLTAIEVQPGSFGLLLANAWANGVEARVRAIHGDLRTSLPPGEFDLVSGSPPYFDVKAGIVSADPQRAAARFELHGDVGDYCRAAASAIARGGRFVFCFPAGQRGRAEAACRAAGIPILASRDVIPRHGVIPLISLFVCSRPDESPGAPLLEPPFVVRDENGDHTAEMHQVRSLIGMR